MKTKLTLAALGNADGSSVPQPSSTLLLLPTAVAYSLCRRLRRAFDGQQRTTCRFGHEHFRLKTSTRPAVALVCYLCLGTTAVVQAQLPDIPRGAVASLTLFDSGLPVTGTAVYELLSATDLAPIPNGGSHFVVSTSSGAAFLYDAQGNRQPTPFLDLSDPASPTYSANYQVFSADAFVSIAFHPELANEASAGYGKFYTLESEAIQDVPIDFDGSLPADSVVNGADHQQALYEYTLDSASSLSCDAICAASKRELLRVQQPGWHHNVNDLAFDGDNYLYISAGDGDISKRSAPHMSDNATLLTNAFGKILRIDPVGNNSANGNYGIPNDNPFVDGPGTNVDEIYAYGVRNPYRISFDTLTGDLYAADVGEVSIESVDRIERGRNHGWGLKEGSFLYDPFTKSISVDTDADGNGIGDVADALNLVEPVFEYDRDDGRAVIGGALYRGSQIAAVQGHYLFAEYRGRLFHGDPTTGQEFEFAFDPLSESLPLRIHSVNQDQFGDVYVLGVRPLESSSEFEGVILRLDEFTLEPGTTWSVTAAENYAVGDTDFDGLGDRTVGTRGGVGENDSAGGLLSRQLVKFDLPLIGRDFTDLIQSVRLRLRLEQVGGAPAGPVSLFHSADDNDLEQAGSDYEDDAYVDTLLDLVDVTSAAGEIYELDVTEFVLSDYAGDGEIPRAAFRLEVSAATFVDDGQSNLYQFTGTRDVFLPQLIITFVPEPSTMLLVSLAAVALGWRWRP